MLVSGKIRIQSKYKSHLPLPKGSHVLEIESSVMLGHCSESIDKCVKHTLFICSPREWQQNSKEEQY